MFREWLRSYRSRRRTLHAARECAAGLRPGEEIRGAAVAADEADRTVVRVFVGTRERVSVGGRLPPWRECLLIAIDKNGGAPALLSDAVAYRPVLR